MQRHITTARIQSPSSINVFRQCPRRYYYAYIKKYPRFPSIHLVRGNIAHSVLEDFFDETFDLSEWHICFHKKVLELLDVHWDKKAEELVDLNLQKGELMNYYQDTKQMLLNWANHFQKSFEIELVKTKDLGLAFQTLTPIRERKYESKQYGVRGFVDVIEEKHGIIKITDYKTSKRAKISEDYKLQLAIYSLMYLEEHGKLPHKASIFFLKFNDMEIEVNQELIDFAKVEIEMVHMKTQSLLKEDYPKKPGYLCKWRTGQCDFYDRCFKKTGFNQGLEHYSQ
jgi:RecB family exonuclease